MKPDTTTRRAFFVNGGAMLGAGVAAAAGAGALAARPEPSPVDAAIAPDEREALRRVHQAFIAEVEDGTASGAAETHYGYRSNARQVNDQVAFSSDGRRAHAVWHVDVKLGMAIGGDSTVAQMARLQGMLADLRWESGRLEVRYAKHDGKWTISELRYRSA